MTDLVILVGGKGKRLGDITLKTPKPLIKIGNNKFLDLLIINLLKYNFQKIYLMCSYQKEKFFKFYHKKKIHNSIIICVDEGNQKDTGGGLFKLKNKINKNFYVINGDSFFDVNLRNLERFKNSNTIGKIALTNNKNYKLNHKINNIKIRKNDLVNFSKTSSNYMNGGIYYFNIKIFDYIPNKKISLENDILNKLINKKKIEGNYFNEKFIDIGTHKNLKFIKKNEKFLSQKAFFLDRDGVINKLKKDDYVKSFKELKFLNGVGKAIRFLNQNNFLTIIITNQACVGKLIISENEINIIHDKMKKKLIKNDNAFVDDIFYSPYYKFSKKKKYRLNKNDRKPNTGMFQKAIKKWNIDINKSFFIGDSIIDKQAATKLNLKFYFKQNGSLYNQIKNKLKK